MPLPFRCCGRIRFSGETRFAILNKINVRSRVTFLRVKRVRFEPVRIYFVFSTLDWTTISSRSLISFPMDDRVRRRTVNWNSTVGRQRPEPHSSVSALGTVRSRGTRRDTDS